jgi:hypothetical protein
VSEKERAMVSLLRGYCGKGGDELALWGTEPDFKYIENPLDKFLRLNSENILVPVVPISKCRKCGFVLKSNWIKCPKCKTPVEEKCLYCGETLEDWMDECPACGKAVVKEVPAETPQEVGYSV